MLMLFNCLQSNNNRKTSNTQFTIVEEETLLLNDMYITVQPSSYTQHNNMYDIARGQALIIV